MKKWLVILVLALLLTLAGAGYYAHRRSQQTHAVTLPSDTTTVTVDRGDIVQAVTSAGEVISNRDVPIKCRAGGEVTELPFDISDPVKKGDLLIQVDPVDEQRALDQAQVALEQSQSRLTEAQDNEKIAELDLATATEQVAANLQAGQTKATNLQRKADRQKELFSQNLGSQEDYETAETDAVQAEADLQSVKIAQEQLKSQAASLEVKKQDVKLAEEDVKLNTIMHDEAKTQLDYTTVTAPMDGVVSDLQIELGSMVSSATSTVGGNALMTLSDLSHIFVNATVDESDIGGVYKGQEVNITADAYPDHIFAGDVENIATTGVNTSNVVTFLVKIEVTSPDKQLLKPQMTATAHIIEARRSNVLRVPVMSVIRKGVNTSVMLWRGDGTTETRAVTVGINDGNMEEVMAGLQGGETILEYKNSASNHWISTGSSGGSHAGFRAASRPGSNTAATQNTDMRNTRAQNTGTSTQPAGGDNGGRGG